jgi:DNA-binding MarR family transcriptional regulator
MKSSHPYLSVELNKLVDLMRIRAEAILKVKFEIDYSQFLILHFANILDNPNQQIISKYMGYTGAGVSKQIDKLEVLKLISKKTDISNRRSNLISLTPKGKIMIEKALPLLEGEFNKYINPKDRQIMLEITTQTILNIQ